MRSNVFVVVVLALLVSACEKSPNALAPTGAGQLTISVSGNISAVPATANLGDQISVIWSAESQASVETCFVSENACQASEILSRNREGNINHSPNQEGEWRYSLYGIVGGDIRTNIASATVRIARRQS
ncbi:MAG: hypothetical protein A2735_03400 [Candidatus Yanofskybacteria bacterium RIFCSPHIGHO2_01_FULL_41_21]|uniref:Uncharacterized protein n=1 Tax=Candidatus Yanofskybacteria bacterium RIFCSPHIGHO2_01_FULL_41_21 TaxID=1802660 RepID=A0A1F8ECB3_9BACT|nr:MAG: hypothetical protein A2735_03400 [Candidatus Yanofskybacteria bacterium RIFCSPHIGHO2_01_FULL_41_21]